MATKPTNTYRWAQESGGTKHNIVEPSSGHKDEGWIPGRGAIAQFFNWLGNGAHEWILYLRDAVFVGEAGQPGATITGGSGAGGKGLVVTAGGTNENAIEAVPTGTGTALVGNAGATSGYGAALTGNATSAPLRIVPQSPQPSSTDEGQEYYDSDDDKLYLFSNGTWQALAAVGTANTWSAVQTYSVRNNYNDGILVNVPTTTDRDGIVSSGNGAGYGVRGTGGATGGGLIGVGGATSGDGVTGSGTAGGGNGGAFSSANGFGVRAAGNATGAPLVVVPQSAQPSSVQKGQIYYDSDTDTLHLYDGAWKTFTVT